MIFDVYDQSCLSMWDEKLNEFPSSFKDIYYTPDYYKTWIEHENAEPYCIYANIEGVDFLYPFFRKQISAFTLDDAYYDIFSAYGYGGVITSTKNITKEVIDQFNSRFDEWCFTNNIIAEFIRENPGIHERNEFVRNADYSKVRTNVYAMVNKDYTIPSKGARNSIKSAIKNNLKVEIDKEKQTLEKFIELYYETAERLKMSTYYLFSKEYFYNIKDYLSNNSKIINIKYEDEIIASSIYFYYANKATYHLSASNFNFLRLNPNDLLLKAIIDECINDSCEVLSLGGGTSNIDDDSLLIFKKKYGNVIKDVYIGKKVHNQNVYNKLCDIWAGEYPHLKEQYQNHFLKYRVTK